MTLIQSPGEIEITGPLIYLAGPISDAANWQAKAVRYLRKIDDTIHVACPRGSRPYHTDINIQYKWEQRNLAYASKQGAILFWLASPQSPAGPGYALRTLFCLGEWLAHPDVDVVVGIEPNFPGEIYVRRRISEDFPRVPMCRDLRRACLVTMSLVQRQVEFQTWRGEMLKNAIGFYDEEDE